MLLHCAIFSAPCVATQAAHELHSVTGVVSQCVLLHVALQHSEVELKSTFLQCIAATCNAIAQCMTPPATFSAIFESSTQLEQEQFLILYVNHLDSASQLSSNGRNILQVAEVNCTV